MVSPTKKVIEIPLTVVTLTNAPNSLRGDLTKWMQEIATGVYVGNFNVKVREKLWARILENIGDGEATISYAYRNEIGYKFDTYNTKREAIDFEGLPLVIVREDNKEIKTNLKSGFSKASKMRKAKKFSQNKKTLTRKSYVVLDIETDGLDYKKNNIIEIGAVKFEKGKNEEFHALIKIENKLPQQIINLTKIDDDLLKEKGRDLEEVLNEFLNFIGDLPLIGYNLNFDIMFINKALKNFGLGQLLNKKYDLLEYVKKENKYLGSYKLENILEEYGINEKVPHRALEDARLTYKLSSKVNKFLSVLERE